MRKRVFPMIFLTIILLISPSAGKTTRVATFPNLSQSSSGDPLVANFTFSPNDVVVNHPVYFYDHSNSAVNYWEWDFGDGAMANATTPQEANQTHIYNSTGNKLVQLFVTDNLNNTASASALIEVRKINTSLALSNSTTTQESSITLTATLTDEYGNPLNPMKINFYLIDNQGQHLIDSAFTNLIGKALVYYQPPGSGVFQVNAVFNGTDIYAGSTSQTQTFEVGFSMLPYAVIASVAIIMMSIVFAYLRWKARKMTGEEPSTPEEEQK